MKTKRKMKKIVSLILSICLVLNCLCVNYFGGNNQNTVKAAETATASQFKEISWKDFGIEDYSNLKVRFSVRGDACHTNWSAYPEMNNLQLRIYNSDTSGKLSEITENQYKTFSLSSKQNYEIFEIDYEWLLNSENKFVGFTFGTYGYNGYPADEWYNVYINNIQIVNGDTVLKDVDLTKTTFGYKDASGITDGTNSNGGAQINNGGIYCYGNYMGTVCKVNLGDVTSLAEFANTDNSVDYEGIKVKFSVRGDACHTNWSAYPEMNNLQLRIYNSDTSGKLSEITENQYKTFSLSSKQNYEIFEIDYEWLLNSENKFVGFTFGTYGYNGYPADEWYNVYINSIQIIKDNVVLKDIDLSKTTFGYKDASGITECTNSNGGAQVNNGGIYCYGNYMGTVCKANFGTAVTDSDLATSPYEGMKVKFSVRGDSYHTDWSENPDMNNLQLRIYNSDTKGKISTITEKQYKTFSLSGKKNYETFEIDLEWLLNNDDLFEGFTFGTYGYNGYPADEWYNVYINSIQIVKGEEILENIDLTGAAFGYKDASGITDGTNSNGGAQINNGGIYCYGNYMGTVCKVTFANPVNFAPITYGEYTEGLENTVFNGDISFTNEKTSVFAYSGVEGGLKFRVVDGKLEIKTDKFDFGTQTYEAGTFGLTSWLNKRFNLKIAIKDVFDDSDGYVVGIWINDTMISDNWITLTATDNSGTFNNEIYLQKVNVHPKSLELAGGFGSLDTDGEIPTGYKNISWEDFGFTGGVKLNAYKASSVLSTTDLNNTLFSGDVVFTSGSEIRYGGDAEAWTGIQITVGTDGKLSINAGGVATMTLKTHTFEPTDFGLNSFANEKINLKIAYKQWSSDNKVVKAAVWINDKLCDRWFTMSANTGFKFGTTLHMVTEGSYAVTPYSVRTTVPTEGVSNIKLTDWNKNVEADGKLTRGDEINGQAHPSVNKFDNVSFNETVKFVGTGESGNVHILCFGGAVGESKTWYGLRFSLSNEKMAITFTPLNGTATGYTLDPKVAGVGDSFEGVELDWNITTQAVDKHLLVYISFNGMLYNNAPFVLYNFADDISNTLVYYDDNDGTNRYVLLGASTKALNVLYHDLSKGVYKVPAGYTKLEKKNSVADDTWTEITATTLNEVGDYRVAFNDGVSDYTQEVVLFKKDSTNVTDLVRVLRTLKGDAKENEYEYQKRKLDVDMNGEVKDSDKSDIVKQLLGTYDGDASVMPVSGYYGPVNSSVTDATFKLVKDAGINQIIQYENVFSDTPAARYQVYQQLTLAQKYGMTITVKDSRLLSELNYYNSSASSEDKVSKVKTATSDYSDFQSFAGVYLIDEGFGFGYAPGVGEDITEYQGLAQTLSTAGIMAYGNLHKLAYESGKQKTATYTYKNYMEQYIAAFKPEFLSYDYYLFMTGLIETNQVGGINNPTKYFQNLAVARDVAANNKIPLRTFVQVGDGYETDYYTADTPSEGEFKWNVNTNLAFGSKGISYFTLLEHEAFAAKHGNGKSGLIQSDGSTTTQWYSYAADSNKQIAAVDDVLMNATNKGLMSTVGKAKTYVTDVVKSVEMKRKSYSSSTYVKTDIHNSYAGATVTASDSAEGAVIGCFEYGSKHALYIVNYNTKAANNITINFDSSKTATYTYNGTSTTSTGTSLNVNLQAGEAVMVVY